MSPLPSNTIHLDLIVDNKNSTVSQMRYGNTHLAIVIEDGHRDQKVFGETRIPAGLYRLSKRTWGRHYESYKRRFQHKFVIEVENVPHFNGILIHIGNYPKDTLGCPLVCTGFNFDKNKNQWYGINSTAAYLKWYEFIDKQMRDGKQMWLQVRREE